MRKVSVQLLTIDELPEKRRRKVLQDYRYFNVEITPWWDFDGLTGFSPQEMDEMRSAGMLYRGPAPDRMLDYDHSDVRYDLDSGSHNYIQFPDCKWHDPEVARQMLGISRPLWNNVYWSFKHPDGRMTRLCYERQDGSDEFTPHIREILDNAVWTFNKWMLKWFKSFSDEYDYLTSDKGLMEYFRDRDTYFGPDNTIWDDDSGGYMNGEFEEAA